MNKDLESVKALLESHGCPVFATVEGANEVEIFTAFERSSEKALLECKKEFSDIQAIDLGSGEVDWDAEWKTHADSYIKGFLQVDLNDFGHLGKFVLKPGPGFGDLSHPTTYLCLKLIATLDIRESFCLDVGSGSGILSVAAAALGAGKILSLDVSEEAVEHTLENAALNGFETIIESRKTPFNLSAFDFGTSPIYVFMNMIEREQEEALKSLHLPNNKQIVFVLSGIRKEGRGKYLKKCHKMGWQLKESLEKEGWLAFIFEN